MGDAPPSGSPPTTATIPNPGVVGSLGSSRSRSPTRTLLERRYWPDPAGATGITVNVTNVESDRFTSPRAEARPIRASGFYVHGGQTDIRPRNVYPSPYSWTVPGVAGPRAASQSAGAHVLRRGKLHGHADRRWRARHGHDHGDRVRSPRSVSGFREPESREPTTRTRRFNCSASGGDGELAYTWSGSGLGRHRGERLPHVRQRRHLSGDLHGERLRGQPSDSAQRRPSHGGRRRRRRGCRRRILFTSPSDGVPISRPGELHDGDAVTSIDVHRERCLRQLRWSFGDGGTSLGSKVRNTRTRARAVQRHPDGDGVHDVVPDHGHRARGAGGPSSACTNVDFTVLDGSTGLDRARRPVRLARSRSRLRALVRPRTRR